MQGEAIQHPVSGPDGCTQLQSCLDDLYRKFRHDDGGTVASHLPELERADPNWFGLCAITGDGVIQEAGDSRVSFTAQSIAKLWILMLALEDHAPETILHKIGVEPTGERFDAVLYSGDEVNHKLNPFMNAGALVALDMITDNELDVRLVRFSGLIQRILGRPIVFDLTALQSRRRIGHHNRAIACLLLGRGQINGSLEELLELYNQLCSLLLDCRDLARLAAVLANAGREPGGCRQLLPASHVQILLSVMQTCGLYDFSGQWAYRVGLPAKSSLCGALLMTVPGQLGFAVYSPPLDDIHQKSVRGLKVCEALSTKRGMHMFRPIRSSMPAIGRENIEISPGENKRHDIAAVLNSLVPPENNADEGVIYNIVPNHHDVDPNAFAACITTVDGQQYVMGDHDAAFLIQSISKVFAYGMALEDHGRATVLQNIDVEPSGNPYDAIIRLEQHSKRPHNPMVNAGGIATSALIKGEGRAHRLERILKMYRRYIGHDVDIDMHSFDAENQLGDRNKAIAYLLRHFGMLEDAVDEALGLYLLQCSAIVNCADLSVMGGTLANAGLNPLTGERAIAQDYVGDLLTVMYTCGMYDFAGEWSFRIGLPAKSGVGGGILAVVPGKMGIAVYSPRLDRHGNSIAGIQALETISRQLDLHIFSQHE